MASDFSNWPSSPSPLRARQRALRVVRAIRAAVRTAKVEWKGVQHDDRGETTLSGNVTFRVEVEADELDGGFVARCLDLPGCVSQGDTEQEAVENLVEAISGVMEARMQRHLRVQPLHDPDERVTKPHRHTIEIPA
jgi:predicted RNase H-like HicB family nuclease